MGGDNDGGIGGGGSEGPYAVVVMLTVACDR